MPCRTTARSLTKKKTARYADSISLQHGLSASAHARARCVTIAVAALAIVACGERGPADDGRANAQPSGATSPSAAAPAATAGSPVGAWERFIPNREAPIAYEVLELFDTGWLILHNAQGGVNAQYETNGGRLALRGALGMLWRDPITYDIGGNTLTLDIPALGPFARSEWTRVQRDPFFGIAAVEGDTVPAKLPELVAAATAGAARDWRADAIPVALDVQRLPSGDFAATLTYVSPSDLAGLRVIVGRWGFLPTELPRASWGDHALPTEFADAPALRTRLTSEGNRDPAAAREPARLEQGPGLDGDDPRSRRPTDAHRPRRRHGRAPRARGAASGTGDGRS